MEFNSLLEEWDFAMKMITWKDLNLNVKIIWNDEFLKKIFEEIKKYEKIVLDTETTSLDVMKAKIVWVSFYLDEKNIFYINRLHKWPRVSDLELKKFLKNLFELDILIIWHNLKYDLEVIENFLKNDEIFDENSQPTQIVLDI